MSSTVPIAVEIPQGYIALPLTGIDDAIARTESLFAAGDLEMLTDTAPAILQALKTTLTELARLDTVYCGIGRHISADGGQISSTLTVAVSEYGERRNPRLTLGDVLIGRRDAGERYTNAELVDVNGRTVLLLDRTRAVPTPALPGYDLSEPEQQVYQIEAIVSSPDGSAIAVVELSTAFADHGEEYLVPIAEMAASIRFENTSSRSSMPFSLDL
ncbi:hypothetical protein [Nocardia bovistercoris]|uniref:Uncharacterized protein n=1 Tax=Nocardia bovistercoris TaxID=2785916 RepID=A0A931N4F4_9NOCA|nr:hypothetical protein [Nocardia bovistercoris]MBH0778657.1 hypothetical protein [Nocardia bovistercoris]